MKTLKIHKTTSDKIRGLTAFDSCEILTLKLSDFYNSRTTKYAGCLDQAPFVKITDSEKIKALGFHPLTKCLITLDPEHEMTKQVLAEKQAEIEAKNARLNALKVEAKKENDEVTEIFNKISNIIPSYKERIEKSRLLSGFEKNQEQEKICSEILATAKIGHTPYFWNVWRKISYSTKSNF